MVDQAIKGGVVPLNSLLSIGPDDCIGDRSQRCLHLAQSGLGGMSWINRDGVHVGFLSWTEGYTIRESFAKINVKQVWLGCF